MPQILGHPLHLVLVTGLLCFFLLFFIVLFCAPAMRQWRRLSAVGAVLEQSEKAKFAQIDSHFQKDNALSHLWDEYKDTLHEQRELDSNSLQYEVVARRSTVPAEAFFTPQTLVDTPLKTEFFRHLPGILTGIGIVGTFTGILIGLQSFQVSADANVVRESLNTLLSGVREAFVVSALAIGLAMIITLAEKLIIAGLYKKVEHLCQLLDGLYQAGAGEEYLSRLVRASEASASEAKQLKQALVVDLKAILEEVTAKQIAASNAATSAVADRIVQGMNEGLKQPLADIQNAVNRATGDQSEAVQRLLVDTMTALTAQIRDLFGSQITGINEMQQQTLQAMTSAMGTLKDVVSEMGAAGKQTTESMTEKLTQAIEAMEGRQSAMDSQVRDLLEHVKANVDSSNNATHEKMQDALKVMGETIDTAVRGLRGLVDKAGERDVARANLIDKQTEKAVTELSSKATDAVNDITTAVTTLVQHAVTASQKLDLTVSTMRDITVDSATKMNQGADRLYAASDKFATAGSATTAVLERAQGLVKQMGETSGALTGSATVLNSAINDYKTTRDSLASMVTDLRATVEAAKREAALTTDVLNRIERSTQALVKAEAEAERYLQQVSSVLGDAHQQFGSQVISTLGQVNNEFHKHLTESTQLLAGAISDLEGVFDKLPR
jgi:hypothetical protein